jgi:hypothetical protein
MVSLVELWLPILLSAIAVFAASSIIHMLSPFHKGDFRAVPREDEVMAALRPFAIPPGDYMMPRPASMADMKSPAFQEKRRKGPSLWMTVLPPGHDFLGASLIQWFVFCLIVSLFAAYVASRALDRGAPYLEVSRFASTTAFVGYGLALWQNSIWYRRKWSTTVKTNIDALIYGFLTGGMVGWLWPR